MHRLCRMVGRYFVGAGHYDKGMLKIQAAGGMGD